MRLEQATAAAAAAACDHVIRHRKALALLLEQKSIQKSMSEFGLST